MTDVPSTVLSDRRIARYDVHELFRLFVYRVPTPTGLSVARL